jgi:hypothetical protein
MAALGLVTENDAIRPEVLPDDLAVSSSHLQVPETLLALAKAERRYLNRTYYSKWSANVRLSCPAEATEQKLKANN